MSQSHMTLCIYWDFSYTFLQCSRTPPPPLGLLNFRAFAHANFSAQSDLPHPVLTDNLKWKTTQINLFLKVNQAHHFPVQLLCDWKNICLMITGHASGLYWKHFTCQTPVILTSEWGSQHYLNFTDEEAEAPWSLLTLPKLFSYKVAQLLQSTL